MNNFLNTVISFSLYSSSNKRASKIYGVYCAEIQKNCPERKQMPSRNEQFIHPEHSMI